MMNRHSRGIAAVFAGCFGSAAFWGWLPYLYNETTGLFTISLSIFCFIIGAILFNYAMREEDE